MSRELEFRAYDKTEKKMLYNFILGGPCMSDGKIFHIMQFTGMKDKHGTKIFEGDVLRFHQAILFSKKNGEIYEDTEAEIVWYEGYGLSGFTLRIIGKHHLRTFDATKGEVIGNVYE